jgi:hypothetical protein
MDRSKRLLQTLFFSAKSLKDKTFLLFPLFLIPLASVLWVLREKEAKLKAMAETVELLEQKASSTQAFYAKERRFVNNPHYLSLMIETISLLAPELQRVQALAKQYPENLRLQERLSFLQGDKNRIRFVQQAETEFKMQNPVQMNENDLKKFLTAIEDPTIEKPLLIMKEFDLKRQKEAGDEIVYHMNAELIQKLP